MRSKNNSPLPQSTTQTGAVLSQQLMQPPVTDTVSTLDDQMSIAAVVNAGQRIKFRVKPLASIKGIFTVGIGHIFREAGPANTPRELGPSLDNRSHPTAFALHQNYPNPFNPTTLIKYDLAEETHVLLKIYDVLGREVRTLVNEVQSAGFKSIDFDASSIPSGVYFYRLQAGGFVDVKKMILLR